MFRLLPIAQVQPPPGVQAPEPVPRQRDLREELMPADPLGLRPDEGSFARIATEPENARLSAIASSQADPGLSLDAREQARRWETVTVILVLAGLLLATIWLYRRRGRANFAGHGNDR